MYHKETQRDCTNHLVTPIKPFGIQPYTLSSILKSSSNANSRYKCRKKQVRIVSPLKWQTINTNKKRDFINTTLTYCNVKNILRSIGKDSKGNYNECVDKLINSEWVPTKQQILFNEKLRAKPIQHGNIENISLKSNEISYLASLNINKLKKWLKYHNIRQPSGGSKYDYIRLVQQNYSFHSPSPDSYISKRPAKKPNYLMCKTPNQSQFIERQNDNHHDIVKPMKLCFDD